MENTNKKRIGIVGGRDFFDYYVLKLHVSNYIIHHNVEVEYIVSGGARGADSLAEDFATEFGYPTKVFLPDWDQFGKKAGPMRNETIIQNSDIVFAFWDGASRGTKSSIDFAKAYGKELIVVPYS